MTIAVLQSPQPLSCSINNMRQQLNVRIPPLTRRELDWLKEQYGMSEGELVVLAIDQLYHREDQVPPIGKRLGKELVEMIVNDKAVLDHE